MAATLMPRQLEPEVMDDPALDTASHRAALRDLSRLNALSRADAPFWPTIRAAVRQAGRPMRLLDVACGGGDVAIGLQRRAQRERLRLTVHGCDVSATAIEVARERAGAAGLETVFEHRDVLDPGLPEGYDIVTCSLFLHHLTRDAAVSLLADMGRKADLVIVTDLQRNWRGLIAAELGVRALARSPVVRTDGPRSVRGAFSMAELAALARDAHLPGAQVRRCFPFRMSLTWSRR